MAPRPKSSLTMGRILAVRFTNELVELLDAYVETWKAQNPGIMFTKADAIRTLLASSLGNSKSRRQRRG